MLQSKAFWVRLIQPFVFFNIFQKSSQWNSHWVSGLQGKELHVPNEPLTSSPKPCPKTLSSYLPKVCGLHGKNLIHGFRDTPAPEAITETQMVPGFGSRAASHSTGELQRTRTVKKGGRGGGGLASGESSVQRR